MSMPGPFEMILIFLAVLLIFGARRIPEIARGLGKGIREFKDATSDIKRELTADDQYNRINPPRPPQQQGYAQGPYGQQQAGPQVYDQPYAQGAPQPPPAAMPPPPQAPPSALTETAYPQGTSYSQPAPGGDVNVPPAEPRV